MKSTLLAILLAGSFLLPACGALGGGAAAAPTATLATVPQPPVDTHGYQFIPLPLCVTAEFTAVQTDEANGRLQGDLLAWSPDGSTLAFLAPEDRHWGWFTGRVVLATLTGETPVERVMKAPDAYGDLVWSPDGTAIAFVALRPQEKLYTVMVADTATGDWIDLFPGDAARLDEWSSLKGILGWEDATYLRVTASCGADCMQPYRADSVTGALEELERTRKVTDASLTIIPSVQEYDPAAFPQMRNPNWSPDGRYIVYADGRGLWLIDTQAQTLRGLRVTLPLLQEVRWNGDGRRVALRTNDQVLVVDVTCGSE